MPNPNPRLSVNLHPDTRSVIKSVSEQTGVSESTIVDQLLGAHLPELVEYDDWLKQLPKDSERWEEGVTFIRSYGPRSLVADIKRVDPNFQTHEERLRAWMTANPPPPDLIDLEEALKTWKKPSNGKKEAKR